MNVENWNWAVWVYLSLWGIGSVKRFYMSDDIQDLVTNVAASASIVALLYFGGFFA